MKEFIKVIAVLVASIWTLLTSKEERRQLEYDLGYGEIEE